MGIVIPNKLENSTLIPPKIVFESESLVVSTYFSKDRPKGVVTYIKLICSSCGYKHEPIDTDSRCVKCRLGDIAFQDHLAVKRMVMTWK